MWGEVGDATLATADVGFHPWNLHWKISVEAGSGSIKDMQPG
jgi:hypothetical protein